MLSSLRDTCEFSACHMWGFCMSHVSSLRVTCEDAAPHLWGLWASHVTTLRLTFEDAAHHMGGLCTSHVKILRITCEDSAPHMSRDNSAPHMWRCCASHGRTRRLTCDDFAHHIWELWVTCEDSVSHITMAWGGAGEEQLQGGLKEMCWTDLCLWLVVRRKQMVHKTLLQICKGQFVGLLGCKVRILLSVNVLYFYALHGSKWTSIWAWCFVLMVNQKSQWNKMEVYLHYKKYIKYYL